MNELSLFSGAGGGLLGTKLLGFRCVGYVEKDIYCQKVLAQRIKDGYLDAAPIFGDIRLFISEGYASSYMGMVDLLTAGFPCQPFSVAGKQLAENDERNLWPETIQTIRIVRPKYALLENVPGLITKPYFGTILGDLSEAGYDIRWDCISAAEVGAPHKRNRLWILAYAFSNSLRDESWRECGENREGPTFPRDNGSKELMAYSPSFGKREPANQANTIAAKRDTWKKPSSRSWWEVEPPVGRVVDGMADRVGQLRALGNGQVPRVVVEAWKRLTT